MVTNVYQVYGVEGHRQRESFGPSFTVCPYNKDVVSLTVINQDMTNTNNHTVVVIVGTSDDACDKELFAQISDGVFENCRVGSIRRIMNTNQNRGYIMEEKVMDKEMKVKVNDEVNLVVQVGNFDTPEISIFVEDHQNGIIWQDIALVRLGKTGKSVEALLWTDENDEDYTHKFEIKLCENEGEDDNE